MGRRGGERVQKTQDGIEEEEEQQGKEKKKEMNNEGGKRDDGMSKGERNENEEQDEFEVEV